MKRAVIALSITLLASSALAGYTYKVTTASTGMQQGTMSGTVEVEGKGLRFNVEHGDGMLFTDSSFVVSDDGGRTLTVVDPSAHSYYVLSLDQLGGGLASVMKQMGGGITIDNPKVSARDLGAGETIEGYATQKKQLDASYDVNVDMMGTKMKMTTSMSTQSWVTDQISPMAASFLQTGEMHTGLESIDKLLATLAKTMAGFPLKQITTTRIDQMGQQMEMTTTTNISGVEKKTIAASEFVVPAGYAKTDSPIEKMMKQMGGAGAAPPRP